MKLALDFHFLKGYLHFQKVKGAMSNGEIPVWMRELSEEDWQFLKRFILLSGSLKDVAGEYGISYPTVRLRLDRLIEKIRVLDQAGPQDPFRLRIQALVASGDLSVPIARTILHEYDKTKNGKEKRS